MPLKYKVMFAMAAVGFAVSLVSGNWSTLAWVCVAAFFMYREYEYRAILLNVEKELHLLLQDLRSLREKAHRLGGLQ